MTANCVLVLVQVGIGSVSGCCSMILHLVIMNYFPALMAITQPRKSANVLYKTSKGAQKRMSAVCILQAINHIFLMVMAAILDAMTHAGCT